VTGNTAMDYDPSILIVSQQAIWPKTDTIALGNFSTSSTGQYHSCSGKDRNPDSEKSPYNSISTSNQYYKSHRTLPNKESPSSTHIHCSIQGSQQPTKSSYSSLTQTSDNTRTSSRDESPMVVVQVIDG